MDYRNSAAVFLCNSYFPYGRAYSSRVLNFCRLFKSIGIKPYVISDFTGDPKYKCGEDYSIEGIHFSVIGYQNKKYVYIQKTHVGINAVKERINKLSEDTIFLIVSAADTIRYKKLKKLYRFDKRVILILESCEWYNKTSFTFSVFDPRYILFNQRMCKEYLDSNRVIAISRYLEHHFSNGSNTVCRIPTILDTYKEEYTLSVGNEKTRLMFAGAIGGNKELFSELLIALLDDEIKNRFELHIYGGTEETLSATLGDAKDVIGRLKDVVFCHGFIDQQKIGEAYRKADYSVIFRPDRRSSHAGFPTKLAESFAAGTPVIANSTGDIQLYLKNGENGYLTEYDRNSIKKCLIKIKALSNEDKMIMRKNARQTAEKFFDFRVYEGTIMSLFENAPEREVK